MWGIPAGLLIRIAAGALGLGLLAGAYSFVTDRAADRREAKVRAEYAERDRQALAALHAAEKANRRKEQSLAEEIVLSKQREADALAALGAANRRIDGLLLNRPARPAAVPGAAATAPAGQGQRFCTGRELYRDDGEFLRREAQRADTLRLALKQCYAQYDAAVKAVNDPAGPETP
jgi:hypothetical protein